MDADDSQPNAHRLPAAAAEAADALVHLSTQLNLLALALDELALSTDPALHAQVAEATAAAIRKARSA